MLAPLAMRGRFGRGAVGGGRGGGSTEERRPAKDVGAATCVAGPGI
jgi:hypothetical protein